MAFVWVPQWFALPVVVEDPMGDASNESGFPPSDPATHHGNTDSRPPVSASSFQSPYSNRSLEVQRPSQQHLMYAYNMHGQHQHQPSAPSPFNMGAINAALPDYTSSAAVQSPQRPISGASTSAVVYQLQQISQYPQAAMGFASQSAYGPAYANSHFSPAYPSFAAGQQRAMAPPQMHQSFVHYPQTQPYMYYPALYPGQPPMNQPPVAYGANPEARRAGQPTAQAENAMPPPAFGSMAAGVTAPNVSGDYGSGIVQGQSMLEIHPQSCLI